jgi:maltoporin
MRTPTLDSPRQIFSPTWSAVAVALAVTATGQAHAQVAPAAQPATPPVQVAQATEPTTPPVIVAQATEPPPVGGDAAPAPAPTTTEAEANPLAEKQLEQIRKMVSGMAKPFVFQGYFRAGTGINSDGGQQVAFKAPLAYSKFRLGNETEFYGEIGLDANWINPDHADGAWFKTSIKLAVVAPRNNTFDVLTAIAMREAYGEAGHIIESHPEMSVWAGSRFYRRKDVHIIDFFFQDTSGYGAGFQDLKVGDKAKLAVAYLGGATPYNNMEAPSDVGKLYKNTIDFRIYDIPAGPGTLELWVLPVLAASGNLSTDVTNNRSGIAGGVFFNVPVMGGFNEVSAEFGYGGAANLSPGIDRGIASGGWLARLVERAAVQVNPKTSMMWSGVVQLDNKNGSAGGSSGNVWISLGARPVYMTSKYTGVAVEAGVDFTSPESTSLNPDTGTGLGVLGKLTLAGLVRPGSDFWARPELRLFVTAAAWNSALKGATGVGFDGNTQPSGNPYATSSIGVTAGAQIESWW